jgi:hypothetical protein
MIAGAFPLLATVVLLFPMGVFMFTTPPLLILKHDTPVDGRFIRGLFNLYYVSVITLASVGAAGCLIVGKIAVALAMGGLGVFVAGIRRWMISNMDRQREGMARGQPGAIPRFRRLHMTGMALNVLQLAIVAWAMTKLAT